MPATIIMGGQWGDEGKGKLTDALATRAHVVVRANGGSNAGHTVRTDAGVFKLHLVPSGILNPECLCVIGAGVVLDPKALITEIDALQEQGIDLRRLRISDRAHVVLPYHPILDRVEEERRGEGSLGTTRRGIGPAYADKVSRHGIRVADLLDDASLLSKLNREVTAKNELLRLFGEPQLDMAQLYHEFVGYSARLRDYVVPSEMEVQRALDTGQDVLVECAQGAMLDIDYGTYPFVTSSSPTAAGACQGAGVAPTQVSRVIAVYKAYSTRVGTGPLPTELMDDIGDRIRERGKEYGTTTGRPRRIGWFDGVAGRYVSRLNGVTEIALTLLDVLDDLPEINVCTGYRLNDVRLDYLPARDDLLTQVEPVWTTLPGWQEATDQATTPDDLPTHARGYVNFLERQLGAPITMIGVGPSRDQLLHRAVALT